MYKKKMTASGDMFNAIIFFDNLHISVNQDTSHRF